MAKVLLERIALLLPAWVLGCMGSGWSMSEQAVKETAMRREVLEFPPALQASRKWRQLG